jgi:hypothetical protein
MALKGFQGGAYSTTSFSTSHSASSPQCRITSSSAMLNDERGGSAKAFGFHSCTVSPPHTP